MKNCTYLVYTHSEYDDVLILFLKRLKKHFPSAKVSICTNDSKLIYDKYMDDYPIEKVYTYDDSLTYTCKIYSVLQQIDTKYVLFTHESNILFNDINTQVLDDILEDMESKHADAVRLSPSGVTINLDKNELPLLKPTTGPYFISNLPTIWLRTALLDFCSTFPMKTYRTVENGVCQEYVSKLKGYYISNKDNMTPHITALYPMIHAVHGGQWALYDFREQLTALMKEYNIDFSIRGINNIRLAD